MQEMHSDKNSLRDKGVVVQALTQFGPNWGACRIGIMCHTSQEGASRRRVKAARENANDRRHGAMIVLCFKSQCCAAAGAAYVMYRRCMHIYPRGREVMCVWGAVGIGAVED